MPDPALLSHLQGFARFLRVLEGLKETSVAMYMRKVEEFLEWLQSISDSSPVASLARQDVEAYMEHCFYRKNGNQTRSTKLTAISKFSRYLKYEGIIPEDISAGIPKPILRTSGRIHKFTQTEVLAFFRSCDPTREKDLRDIVIFIMAAFCGLRTAEIYGLTLEDIQEDDKGDIDVSVLGKFDKGRRVYLWKSPGKYVRQYVLVRIAQGARPNDPLLVSYRHHRPSRLPIEHSAISSMLHKRAVKAGIRKARVNMHMFRATHASDLRHVRGYDAPAIAQRLGHSNISTTDRYLPERGRIHKIYQSLDHYWSDFKMLWPIDKEAMNGDDRNAGADGGNIAQEG